MRYYLTFAFAMAALFVTAPNSYAGSVCDSFRIKYAQGLAPKAFAVGRGFNGQSTCGYATAGGNARATSVEDAKSKAMNYCAGYGTNCHVIMSDGRGLRDVQVTSSRRAYHRR